MKNIVCIVLTLLISCVSNKIDNINKPVISSTNDSVYYFEPYKCKVQGVLKMKKVFGAPNYGETPKIDKKEIIYLLLLDHPISILPIDSTDEINERKDNITCFQLIGDNLSKCKNKIGTKIYLNGMFFSAISGHHYTEVIFDIDD